MPFIESLPIEETAFQLYFSAERSIFKYLFRFSLKKKIIFQLKEDGN